jgi:hypothetical protein
MDQGDSWCGAPRSASACEPSCDRCSSNSASDARSRAPTGGWLKSVRPRLLQLLRGTRKPHECASRSVQTDAAEDWRPVAAAEACDPIGLRALSSPLFVGYARVHLVNMALRQGILNTATPDNTPWAIQAEGKSGGRI